MSACKFGNETSVPPRPVASTGAVDRPDTTDPTIEDAGEGAVPGLRICPRKGAVPGRTFGWRGVFMLTSDFIVRGIAGITDRACHIYASQFQVRCLYDAARAPKIGFPGGLGDPVKPPAFYGAICEASVRSRVKFTHPARPECQRRLLGPLKSTRSPQPALPPSSDPQDRSTWSANLRGLGPGRMSAPDSSRHR